jgi:hypothetical protein
MKNSKLTLTINKEDMDQNDYLYCWSEMGVRPNKMLFHSFYDAFNFLQFLEGFSYQNCGEFSEVMPIDESPIINEKKLYKIEDGFYVSFTIFDKLNEEKLIGDVSIIYSESHSNKIDEWLNEFNSMVKNEEDDTITSIQKVNVISIGQNGFELFGLNLPTIELEQIDTFFDEDTINKTERIIKRIRKGENGLSIFWGERGSGKTTLTNYIISEIENSVIYIPLNMVDLTINSPEFTKFLREHKNSILILDDAEIHFSEIFSKTNFYTNNLLQLVDGLGSKELNLNLILILNNKNLNEIDSNLLKCNNILDIIKVEQSFDQKTKKSLTFTSEQNRNLNDKRSNLTFRNRFSKNENRFGYK